METPPSSAAMWPSSEVPVPKAMTGMPCAAQTRTIAATSSVEFGEGDGVGRVAVVVGGVLAVLLAHRRGGREPVAEEARGARRSPAPGRGGKWCVRQRAWVCPSVGAGRQLHTFQDRFGTGLQRRSAASSRPPCRPVGGGRRTEPAGVLPA